MATALRSTPRAGSAAPGWSVPEAAIGEWALLQLLLVDLQGRGDLAPCQADPESYFASGRDVQEIAAEACTGCPVRPACRAYAEVAGERYGVWGGLLPPARGERRRRAVTRSDAEMSVR